jgi:hypothetical protein
MITVAALPQVKGTSESFRRVITSASRYAALRETPICRHRGQCVRNTVSSVLFRIGIRGGLDPPSVPKGYHLAPVLNAVKMAEYNLCRPD